MTNKILSTEVPGDRSVAAQSKDKRAYVRDHGLDDIRPLTARELAVISLEDKLRELRARLDELEREQEEAKRYRPRVAAEIRVVTRQELSSFPTYSR
jgi:hypothetical protein